MINGMDRINQIFHHPLYQEHFQFIQKAEQNRIFCNHTLSHFLDVARLMYIRNLEEKTGLEKELIYASALLHDIGRSEQIRNGTPHHIAGAKLAGEILSECGFSGLEIIDIQYAISCHRRSTAETNRTEGEIQRAEILADYLYDADKASRCCFSCNAVHECNWSQEKKNMRLKQ